MLPILGIATLTLKFIENKRFILASISQFIYLFVTNLVNLVWVIIAFVYFIRLDVHNLFPYLLLGYNVATGPFTYMASKESLASNSFVTSLGIMLIQISYIILFIAFYLNSLPLALVIIFILKIVQEVFLTYMSIGLAKENLNYVTP